MKRKNRAIFVDKNFPDDRKCAELEMNEVGKIDECWLAIPEHFTNAVLHEYIVMPNHVHGIIELKHVDTIPNGLVDNVGTRHVVSLPRINLTYP